ncbi:LPD29 domain-containing protein [Paraburkholderia sp. SIMBA_009]
MVVIAVGQRVHSILYGGRNGIVYEIHGEQCPDSVKSIGEGVVMRGGRAEFDIVFDNGTTSKRLPECILRGVQWRVYGEIATADEITAALANAATTKADKTAREAEAKQCAADERARLATAEEYKHLKQGDDKYSGKLAAANMRIELKLAFPGVKFSVRKSQYGSVSVQWTDGPTTAQVDAVCLKYKAGHFNGMEDIYENDIKPWHEVFGGVDYLNTSREESPALIAKAIDAVYAEYAGNLVDIPKPTPELFKRGALFCVNVPGLSRDLQYHICAQLRDMA